MRQLNVFLFGPPRIERDGQRIEIGLRKAVALFAYLAVNKQPHSRDTLATLFWPKDDQETALANLRRALHRLNRILGGGVLAVNRKTVEINQQAEIWLDTEVFQRWVAGCFSGADQPGQLLSSIGSDSASCLRQLEEAAELYTNDFLSGFSLPDSPDFDEWQFFQAENLRQLFGKVLAVLTQAYQAQSIWQQASEAARRWVALDPLDEFAQRSLIELYARTGQHAAALRQYHKYEQLLADELGIRPESETTALFQAVKSRQLSESESLETAFAGLDRPASPVPPPNLVSSRKIFSPGPPQNLPAQPFPFVGRKKELADIHRFLVEDLDFRLLTIIGPGGIGKTRLALEAAYAAVRAFPDGVYFIPLASLPSADLLLPAMTEHLGLRSHEGSARGYLLNYIREKRILLVLDNFEHLLSGAGIIAEILQSAPGVKILVTTRERLGISGEMVYVLGHMAFPEKEYTGKIHEFGALQLLIQCARLARPNIDIHPQDFPELVRICRLVQGMPLAIVLGAGWLEALSFREVADEIEQSLDFLEARMGDVPERHNSVRAAFDSSWKRLLLHDQQAFMHLSVFRGGFTRHAAQQVAGASLRSLRTLIQKSLVSVRRDGRYEIHELLRHYAAERLEDSSAGDTLLQAHSEYFLGLVSQLQTDLKGARQFAALDAIDADFENVRAAWSWAVLQLDRTDLDMSLRQRIAAAVSQAAEAMYLFFAFRSRYPEGVELFRLARERLISCTTDESWLACVRVVSRFAWLQTMNSPQEEQIEADIRFSLNLAQREGDAAEEAFCWMVLGMYTYVSKQDPDSALPFYERSLALFQSVDDPFYIACALYYLGECHGEVTGLEAMIGFTRQSIEVARQIGNTAILTFSLHNLARAAFYAGDYSASENYCQEALLLDARIGLSLGTADSKIILSILHLLRGDFDKASALAGECLEISREINFSLIESEALAIQSLLSSLCGNGAAGKQLGEESLGVLSSTLGRILAGWGMSVACFELGQYDLARNYLRETLREAARLSFTGLMYLPVPVAALLESRRGHTKRAVELLSLAHRVLPNLNAWWNGRPRFAELGPHLKASLDPQTFHSAWERGQTSEPSTLIAELLQALV